MWCIILVYIEVNLDVSYTLLIIGQDYRVISILLRFGRRLVVFGVVGDRSRRNRSTSVPRLPSDRYIGSCRLFYTVFTFYGGRPACITL